MIATVRLVARWGPRPENRRPARLFGQSERLVIEAFDRATDAPVEVGGLAVSIRRPQGLKQNYDAALLTAAGIGRWVLDIALNEPGPWIAEASCDTPRPARARAAVDCLPPLAPLAPAGPTFDGDDITMDMG